MRGRGRGDRKPHCVRTAEPACIAEPFYLADPDPVAAPTKPRPRLPPPRLRPPRLRPRLQTHAPTQAPTQAPTPRLRPPRPRQPRHIVPSFASVDRELIFFVLGVGRSRSLLLILLLVAVIARRRAARKGHDPALTQAVQSGTQAHERLAADLAAVSVDRTIPPGLAESERLLDVFTGQLASLTIPPDQPGLLSARADLAEATASLRESLRPLLGATSLSLGTMASDATTRLTVFEAALGRFRDAAEAPHT